MEIAPVCPRRRTMSPEVLQEHPSAAQLRSFAEGRLDRESTRQIVSHLLRGCQVCRKETSRLVRFGEFGDLMC